MYIYGCGFGQRMCNTNYNICQQVDAVAKGLAALPPTILQILDLYDPEAQRLLRICNWQAYLKDPPPEDDAGCGCS